MRTVHVATDALTRGAELKVIVGDGDYVFGYRPLGEFA